MICVNNPKKWVIFIHVDVLIQQIHFYLVKKLHRQHSRFFVSSVRRTDLFSVWKCVLIVLLQFTIALGS